MTRTRDKTTSTPFVDYERTWRNGSLLTEVVSDSGTVKHYDVMTDVVAKHFKKRSATGEVLIHPMSKLRSQTEIYSGIGLFAQWNGNASTPHANYVMRWQRDQSTYRFGSVLPVQVLSAIEKTEGLAITEAYARVGSPDVATLTELAELRETLQFLASPLKQLTKLTKRYYSHVNAYRRSEQSFKKALARWERLPISKQKKRPKPKPRRPKFSWGKWSVDDVASLWLAYRYAVMPIIYTIDDVQKHLERSIYPERDTARAKVDDDVEYEDEQLGTVGTPLGGGTYAKDVRFKITAQIVSRAGVLYTPDWSISRQLGFQWNRVPMALYEAIPLSFVTDWLHNAASYYDALTAECRSAKILGAWVTSHVIMQRTVERKFRSGNPNMSVSSSYIMCARETSSYKVRRKVTLADARLALRVEMNAKRIADAFALVKVILLKSKT